MLKHRHSSTLFLLQRGMELLGALRVSWDFVGSHLQKAHLGAQFGVVNGYTASASWDITPLAYVSYTYVSTCKHLIYIYITEPAPHSPVPKISPAGETWCDRGTRFPRRWTSRVNELSTTSLSQGPGLTPDRGRLWMTQRCTESWSRM